MNGVLFPIRRATKTDSIVRLLPRKRRENGKQNFAKFHSLVFGCRRDDRRSPQKVAQPFWPRNLDRSDLFKIDPAIASRHKDFESPADPRIGVRESGEVPRIEVARGFESFAWHGKARIFEHFLPRPLGVESRSI